MPNYLWRLSMYAEIENFSRRKEGELKKAEADWKTIREVRQGKGIIYPF